MAAKVRTMPARRDGRAGITRVERQFGRCRAKRVNHELRRQPHPVAIDMGARAVQPGYGFRLGDLHSHAVQELIDARRDGVPGVVRQETKVGH
jgi:hypothetical protein